MLLTRDSATGLALTTTAAAGGDWVRAGGGGRGVGVLASAGGCSSWATTGAVGGDPTEAAAAAATTGNGTSCNHSVSPSSFATAPRIIALRSAFGIGSGSALLNVIFGMGSDGGADITARPMCSSARCACRTATLSVDKCATV
jgi:hypothetical protein